MDQRILCFLIYLYTLVYCTEALCPLELLNSTARPVTVNASSGSISSPISLTTTGWNSGLTTFSNQTLQVPVINLDTRD